MWAGLVATAPGQADGETEGTQPVQAAANEAGADEALAAWTGWIASWYSGDESAVPPSFDTLPLAFDALEAHVEANGGLAGEHTYWMLASWAWYDLAEADEDLGAVLQALDTHAARGRLRRALMAAGLEDFSVSGDTLWISHFLERGEFARAEAEARAVLPGYVGKAGPTLWMQVHLADSLRLQERWQAAFELLEELAATLAEQPADPGNWLELESAAMVHGVRVQLEMMLGRLGRARELAELEQAAVARYLAAFPPSDDFERSRDIQRAAWVRACDLDLMSGREELLIAALETADLPHTEVLRLHYLGKALTTLAATDPAQIAPARSSLEAALERSAGAAVGLTPYVRSFVHASRARLAELAGDAPAMAAALDDMQALLAAMGVASEPAAEAGAGGAREDLTRPRALYASLRCRWQTLVVAGGGSVGAEAREAALDELDQSLRELIELRTTAPEVAGGVGDLQDVVRRTVVVTLLETAAELGRTPAAFERVMELQAAGGQARARGAGNESFPLARIQRALAGDGGLLVWLPAPHATVLLVVDARGLTQHELASGLVLGEAVERLDRELGHAGFARTARVVAAAEALQSELFPADVQARLAEWEHVYFVGAEALGHPAFEALPWGADGTFGTELALGYLPSVPLGVLLAEGTPAPRADARLAVFAGPPDAAAPERASLEFDVEVWRGFAGPFDGERLELVSGPAVTRAALVAQDWSTAGALNLFCHGVFDGARLLPAGLAIPGAEGAAVWWEDIAGMRLPPLVVLSACGAARGPDRLGEDGVGHLGGAFLSAGASAVLVARGDLEIRTTLEFNHRFHARLHAGASPLVALRDARRAARASGQPAPRLDQLVLLGAGHAPLFAPEPRRAPLLFGLLAVGVALGVLGARRRRGA